jgi:hypothetical protein
MIGVVKNAKADGSGGESAGESCEQSATEARGAEQCAIRQSEPQQDYCRLP